MENKVAFPTSAGLPKLRAMAERYGVPLDVEAVLDIQQWSHDHGLEESNPFRVGKVVRNNETGRFLVLLADPLTSSMIGSVIEAMMYRGFGDEADALREPTKFAQHLLLHEIAHALDVSRTEADCDRWAFDQLASVHELLGR